MTTGGQIPIEKQYRSLTKHFSDFVPPLPPPWIWDRIANVNTVVISAEQTFSLAPHD